MGLERFRNRENKDRDLAEEMQSHLAHEEDANVARGLSDGEARRQARLKFGNPLAVRERVWNYRSFPLAESTWRDARYAWRSLRQNPGFTLVALLVIALGIGVNTAVFSVVNTVLLQPLHYPDPQSLVHLVLFTPQRTLDGASVPEFNLWRQQTSVLREVAGYDTGGAGLNLTGGDHPMQVQGVHVTHDYFALFNAPLIAGRTFTPEEDTPHGGNVVVLSYSLWKRRFGGDAGIVGRTIELDNHPISWWEWWDATSSPTIRRISGSLINSTSIRRTWRITSGWQRDCNRPSPSNRQTRNSSSRPISFGVQSLIPSVRRIVTGWFR